MSIWSSLVRVPEKKHRPPKLRIAKPPPADDAPVHLSPQQQRVLEYLALGHSQAQVASELNISPRTLDVHLARIRVRVGVKNTDAAVSWWMRSSMAAEAEARRAQAEAALIAKLT